MNGADTAMHPWVAEGQTQVRFGIETIALPDWPATRDFVQAVEGLGFDSLWLPDHPMQTMSATWTTLAAIATATERVRLGTLVACTSYWNPVVLARAAADIDRLSGGRFVLGLGSGDMPGEFAHMGIDWRPAPERQATLAEALQIIRPLLRGETVNHAGERFRAEGAVLVPPPVQQPYVPLLIAGGGERTTLRYVAEYGDASNFGAVSWAGGAFLPDDLRRKCAVLDEHYTALGRSSDAILRTGLLCTFLSDSRPALEAKLAAVPQPMLDFFERLLVIGTADDAVTRVQALLDAGMQYVIFIVMPFDRETLHLLAERVLPAIERSAVSRSAQASSPVG